MRKSRFTEVQMVAILREADRTTVAEVARKHKVSEQTLYGWRKRFGEMDPTDIKRLRELESENAKLKDAGGARDGDRHAQGDQPKKVVSSQGRMEQVRHAIERGHSQRRACELIGLHRSSLTYRHRMPQRDGPVLQAMQRLAQQYPRYGYRRIRIFLAREGHEMSWEKAHRLWRRGGTAIAEAAAA